MDTNTILQNLVNKFEELAVDVQQLKQQQTQPVAGAQNRFLQLNGFNMPNIPFRPEYKSSVNEFFKTKLPQTIKEGISLYEFLATFGLIIVAVTGLNLYATALVVAIAIKHAIDLFIKKVIFARSNSPNVQRPPEATDCNMINKGGLKGKSVNGDIIPSKDGMPSGHSIIASFLATIQVFEAVAQANKTGSVNNTGLLIFTIIMAVLMMWARVSIKCHNSFQVLAGSMIGIVLGGLFVLVENNALIKNPRYVADKEKFYALFEIKV